MTAIGDFSRDWALAIGIAGVFTQPLSEAVVEVLSSNRPACVPKLLVGQSITLRLRLLCRTAVSFGADTGPVRYVSAPQTDPIIGQISW